MCPTVTWKTEFISNKLEYLAELVYKQIVEGAAWFLLTAYSKIEKERDKWKEEWLRKQEPGLDDWGNSQPVQIAKDAKIRIFNARKVCSAEKAKGVTNLLLVLRRLGM